MILQVFGTLINHEDRKSYFFKVVLYCLMGSAYFFAALNFLSLRIEVGMYNLFFAVLFTIMFFIRNRNLELTLLLTGVIYQIFFFGHSYFLLPGKQLEGTFGIMTVVLPLFISGYRMWFFFILNFILYHLILFNVGYEDVFYFKYIFYVFLFVVMYTIIEVNSLYEKELIIQRDKIKRDAEDLKELDELKTRFFANISHELRTPLTLVLSPLESILSSNELSNQNFTYLTLVQQNGQKLLKRINELLELSRLDAKRLDLNPQATNIYQLTKQISASYESTAKIKGIQLSYENGIEEDINLLVDAPKVEMVVSNYLNNALKFTPENGSINIKIGKKNSNLEISVRDTGIGISRDELDKVFNRFYQIKNKNYTGGSGIGLALCKELIELHQGKVYVESEVGKGSIFYLELPYEEVDAPIETVKVEVKVEVESPQVENEIILNLEGDEITSKNDRLTVMVVEDNADLRKYMRLLLSEQYNVITAKNGTEALELLKGNNSSKEKTNEESVVRPSLIISDIMMPKMDGMELLKILKSSDDFRPIPVILLTAQKHSTIKIEALRIGVDDYLTKPFKSVELLARIENLIANSQLRLPAVANSDSPEEVLKTTIADMNWLKEVENKILENIGETDFSMNQLAIDLFLIPRTLQKKIKRITGKTPKQYQRDIQMDVARKKIKSGEVSTVSELSSYLGFENQYYFSKLYKQNYGVTPKEDMYYK